MLNAQFCLKGQVLDVGSSAALASYHRYFKKETPLSIECLDLSFSESGQDKKHINLESDVLPYANASIDSALLFNVMEHLHHYAFVLGEVKRVLKPGGQLIGAVPFLVNYHPDPHDYWRFINEALEQIFKETGFQNITVLPFGMGPFGAAFSLAEPALPRPIKILLFPLVATLDFLVKRLNPKFGKGKFPLGYFFVVSN